MTISLMSHRDQEAAGFGKRLRLDCSAYLQAVLAISNPNLIAKVMRERQFILQSLCYLFQTSTWV